MNQKDNNLLNQNSMNQQDKNISRLMKLADDSNKPSRAFTESLIENALGKLEHLKAKTNRNEKNITIKVNWWEKVMGLAALFAVVCLAGLGFVASQMSSFFAIIVFAVMLINRIVYIGGLIL